ncbi:phosphoenolpyruvate synthase [Oxalobacteraceae bacterium R-40]|uniref:Phosphoenolpyruvate synthase n=1 Tax=Keguizhuia sedimenti TaxID=3064264 RepID=A0ABU1BS59_9BURK|nr:phosphoenolpyruvate synthase [Oxalobacteraceae bacterium R-40]
MTQKNSAYIRWFGDLTSNDVGIVGGKNASLGEMYRELNAKGVNVPNGFAITAEAYKYLLQHANAWPQLHQALDGLDVNNVNDLSKRAEKARNIIYNCPLPDDLAQEILEAHATLKDEYGPRMTVAVRSSATAEDLPTASFAGQHETYLNVADGEALLDAIKNCFASLFKDRAIRYREDRGFDHFKVFLSVGVMKMVRADLASSGVTFSLDTETGFRDVVFITGAYGLGENVVQGTVDTDEFYVFKPTFREGHNVVLSRSLGRKEIRMVYAEDAKGISTRNIPTAEEERKRFCISDSEVTQLADAAIKIEDHYSARAGHPVPMDIEWAKDGDDGRLYIVQARPETVSSRTSTTTLELYSLRDKGNVLAKGRSVGSKIATGRVRVIREARQLEQFQTGEVLVAETTSPDWGTVMKRASAIVTDRGGRTCHAAIVARELGIPAVIGCGDASKVLTDGMEVTVSCAEGDVGRVYSGQIPFDVKHFDVSAMQRPRTKVMVNLGNANIAFKTSFLPNDGVGLARMEFIIAEHIKAHPMALAHPERIKDAHVRDEIMALAPPGESPKDYFIRTLSEQVGQIAAAFYPKPVIVRMSDFKSNEYASLMGGRDFEPHEENPMIGFRGASRYAHPAYRDGFALECAAMKRVREEMGLKNVRLMIPFCRRVQEAEQVLATMEEFGLARGRQGLEIYVMCEIPNNVVQVDAFARLFDGFSIGSNDLTQLVLGVDRDSEIVAFDFDELDAGVKAMIRLAVEGARRNDRHSGICGQAPSDYPEMVDFLIGLGIDSISLNPDTILNTTLRVLETEKRLGIGSPPE